MQAVKLSAKIPQLLTEGDSIRLTT